MSEKVVIIFRSTKALDVFPTEDEYLIALRRLPGVHQVLLHDVSGLDEMIDIFCSYEFTCNTVLQLIIQGHGKPNLLELGNDKIVTGSPEFNIFLNFIHMLVVPSLAMIGSIFLHGCSLGKDKPGLPSFAKIVSSKVSQNIVYAASGDIRMGDLELVENPYTGLGYRVGAEVSTRYRIVSFLNGKEFFA